MNSDKINDILNHLSQGKRCYFEYDDDELSTIVTIEFNENGSYTYQHSTSQKHDVISPTQYDIPILKEEDLRLLLNGLSEETFPHVSYAYKDIINEKTREKVEWIYSSLKQRSQTIYVVLKEDQSNRNDFPHMHFNSMFKTLAPAEQMVNYLITKLGANSYWKEVNLSLQGEEIQLGAEFSELENVNSRQILATLLDMNKQELTKFFES